MAITKTVKLNRKELEDNEPYATRTIDMLFNAEHEVWDLLDYISELEEE